MSAEGPWAPQWAPHAEGTWTKRTFDAETGEVEPAVISLSCKLCGESQTVLCLTGNVKGWINRWGSAHFHGNPLDAIQVRKQAEEAKARREGSSSSSVASRTEPSDAGLPDESTRGG